MSNALEVLIPLYLYNQSFAEYPQSVQVNVFMDGVVRIEQNPTFDTSLFLSFIPVFKGLIEIENEGEENEEKKPYHDLFNAYKVVANQKLNYNKFGADWYLLMANYIAHKMQLTFQEVKSNFPDAISNPEEISTISQGVITAGKAGDVSYTINNMLTDKMFSDAGEFNMTRYGKIFWSTFKRYSMLLSKGLY